MAEEIKIHKGKKYQFRSIYFPLLLVAVGVVLLLNSLNVIQGNTWDVLIRLWPVLFIIGGLDSLFQRQNYVSSVFGIGVGVLFLMYYFNILQPWDIHLWDILRLWPFLLLGWGLDIIVGRRTVLALLVGVVVGLLLTAAMVWLLINPLSASSANNVIRIDQALGEAKTAEVDISMTSARLNLSGGTEPSQLVSGEAALRNGEDIISSYALQDTKGVFRLDGSNLKGYINSSNSPGLDLMVNSTVPLTLYTDVNVGEQNVDLSGVQIERFNINQSVGQVVLTLPEDLVYHGSVFVPVGEITIKVPKGAVVRINLDKGVTVLSYPPDYTRRGDVITSAGAETDDEKVATLQVNLPVGMIRIVEIP